MRKGDPRLCRRVSPCRLRPTCLRLCTTSWRACTLHCLRWPRHIGRALGRRCFMGGRGFPRPCPQFSSRSRALSGAGALFAGLSAKVTALLRPEARDDAAKLLVQVANLCGVPQVGSQGGAPPGPKLFPGLAGSASIRERCAPRIAPGHH